MNNLVNEIAIKSQVAEADLSGLLDIKEALLLLYDIGKTTLDLDEIS